MLTPLSASFGVAVTTLITPCTPAWRWPSMVQKYSKLPMLPAVKVRVELAPGLLTCCEATCRSGTVMSCSAPSIDQGDLHDVAFLRDQRRIDLALDVPALADI